jgi:hypothetical protein
MDQNQPKNYLIEAILVTIFCCQPFGIVSIVYAAQVNSKYAEGNYESAKNASKSAKNWMIAALISGLLILFSTLIFIFVMGGLAMMGSGEF